jgi:protein-disulfide isomerase
MAKGHRTEQERLATQAKREQRRARTERAKAAAEARKRAAKRKERLIYIGVVLAVVVVVAGAYFVIRAMNDTSDTEAPPAGASGDFGVAIGADDAEHEVVIYEDFLCPACQALESQVNDQLATAVDDGTVRVEYRAMDFLSRFGDYSMRSANAFAAVLDVAGPDVAKDFHDRLYAEQPSESGPFPDDDWLVEHAVAAGADEDQVRPLIEDLGFEGWIVDGSDAASKAGVRATPTVYVDGKEVTAETMDGVVQAVLAVTK